MQPEYSLHEELRGTYEKTLELAVSITQSKADVFSTKVSGQDVNFIKSIAKGYHDFRNQHDEYVKLNYTAVKSVSPDNMSYNTTTPTAARSKAIFSKYAGKMKLNTSLDEAGAMLAQTKAGNTSSIRLITQSSTYSSPILKKIQFTKSLLKPDDSESKLPYVSLTNGRTEPPLDLPSYKEYLKSSKTYLKKESTKQTSLQRIDRCQLILSNLKKEITGLEIFCNENPGIP